MPATLTRSLMAEYGLDDLTPDLRKRLVHELVDSLVDVPPAENAGFTEEWRAELQRRIENAKKHPELGMSWETVEAELRSRLKCTN